MSKLLPGENMILKHHQHWIFLAKALWVPVVLVIVALAYPLYRHWRQEYRRRRAPLTTG